MNSILSFIFPRVRVCELYVTDPSTFNYLERMERLAPPQVDSEAGQAVPMALIADEGMYLGDGNRIQRIG